LNDGLQQIVCGPEQDIDLAQAALMIAVCAYPTLDVSAYLAKIDDLAEALRQRLAANADVAQRLQALNAYLFQELGFAPNLEDYYDPRNSFLNQVLDRRVGIPISLSVLYIEIGRRVGLDLQGISFPGHFLVKCALPEGLVVIDPYSRGATLSLTDLQDRLREHRGGEVSKAIVAGLLVAAGKKDILGRMLRNLKAIYLRSRESPHALYVLNAILAMTPDSLEDLRDRGLVYQELECARAAASDLERYLMRAPDAPDTAEIRRRVVDLRKQCALLH
jgi:regulator of sirC expression with transglutaminase-like and TPR domain